MTGRQPAAVSVDGQLSVGGELSGRGELAAFALAAEAEILQRQQDGDREAVVKLSAVDLRRSHACRPECAGSGSGCGGRGERPHLTHRNLPERFPEAEQVSRLDV